MKRVKSVLSFFFLVVLSLALYMRYEIIHEDDWQYERAYALAVAEIEDYLYAPTQAQIPDFDKRYITKGKASTMPFTISDGSYLDGTTIDIDVTDYTVTLKVTAPNLLGVMLTDTFTYTFAIPNDSNNTRYWIRVSD